MSYIGSKRSSSLVSFDEGTIGSGVVFPAGHIISVPLCVKTNVGVTSIYTGSTSYDSLLGFSFQTTKSSADSFLVFNFYSGMSNYYQVTTQFDFCLTSASTTTHSSSDSLFNTTNNIYINTSGPTISYNPISIKALFKTGTNVTTNLTSYAADDTLYCRIFGKVSSNSTVLAHSNSFYQMEIYEISK
jgi:hypothetical protein